jgi:cellulose synthase/poly-beta-1,6-N-acetylglucosamine synthase-like glycosyltransferase
LSFRGVIPLCKERKLRFDIIVPAHNEAVAIGRTVASLRRINWPGDHFRVVVCADNCTDETALNARTAGAHVVERQDPTRRGKGYALDFAFATSRLDAVADAVAVVDADAEVSENFLEAIAARLEQGACCVQVHYGVLNPLASWRTRLITIAKGSFHIVRSRAREHLGLSCGIRGTGWCVTHKLLGYVPYRAFSLTEDVEYGIELGLAGYRVVYADEAHCDAEMVVSEAVAAPQRARWEQGRFALVRSRTLPLLWKAIERPSKVCLDLAVDLLVLPISYVSMNIVLLLACASLSRAWTSDISLRWLWLGVGCTLALTLYVVRGWQLSGIGLQGIADLARAPQFLLWKVRAILLRRRSQQWERTERERS